MKNLFAYDFVNNTIVASKTTLKKASNPTTPEYKALMKMIAGQPSFRVVEKVINNSKAKDTHHGLTTVSDILIDNDYHITEGRSGNLRYSIIEPADDG